MRTKTDILSDFLNQKITKDQMRKEISQSVPLIFTVDLDTPGSKPKLETIGSYKIDGEEIFKPYSWYKEEAKNRDIAICICMSKAVREAEIN